MNKKLRLEILKRDNFMCQICFVVDKKLIIHHIIQRRLQGRDVLDNLITLCNPCHGLVENKGKRYDYLIKSSKKRLIITPCCQYQQTTLIIKRQIITCTKCKYKFVES